MKHLATIQAEYLKHADGMCACGGDHLQSEHGAHADKEAKPKNPWAICNGSTGRDSGKYEDCVKDVKKEM